MTTMENILGGFVIFIALISLCINMYVGVIDNYGLSDSYEVDDRNIFESLQDLGILKAVNDFNDAMQKIGTSSNAFDLLGGLLIAGIGIIKIMMGAVIFPVQIFNVITNFYNVPSIISTTIIILSTLTFGFILVKYYTRVE